VANDNLRRALARGELVPFLFRLGHQSASGVLTINARAQRSEVFVLHRGFAIVGGTGELEKRALVSRLVRLAAQDVAVVFEGGVNGVVPPVGSSHRASLVEWARTHLEAQLDGSLAETIAQRLAGARLTLRPELAPPPRDEADRRMLLAMSQPRRLDQIWPLARTPRFRLLAFVHFLMAIDALAVEGVVTEQSGRVTANRPPPTAPLCPRRIAAMELLGIDETADAFAVKRAYRRLARALHPDLQPDIDAARRRALERRFAEVTAAYEALL
jgi:DnaJ-domain-containing protein 1